MPSYKMPKTTEEKKQQEMKRQEVLLKHATSLYLNEDMTYHHVRIIWDNVKELMSVTKINKELAVVYLNRAMRQGQGDKMLCKFDIMRNEVSHTLNEDCHKCGETQMVWNGLYRMDECDDDEPTCIVKYQWFYCKRSVEEYDKKRGGSPFYLKLARKRHEGLCDKCMPKRVNVYEEDLPEDVELWHHGSDKSLKEHQEMFKRKPTEDENP